jgi:HEAT repeat protein
MFVPFVFAAALPWSASSQSADVAQPPAANESVAASDAAAQETKLAAIAAAGIVDTDALRRLMRDRDPVVGSAAFHAWMEGDRNAALQELLDVVVDTTEPTRLRALQLLLAASDSSDAAGLDALRTALADADSALVVLAVQTLMNGDDPAAASLLSDALRDGSVATRRLIVQTVGAGDDARGYLYSALNDVDETVRSAAAAALSSADSEPPTVQ